MKPLSANGSPSAAKAPDRVHFSAEAWLTPGLFLLTFGFYASTLATGICPGESGTAMAKAFGLIADTPATHPLWLLVVRAVAKIPFLDPLLRLNAFSALCGSLAVALLFRITSRLFFEFVREPICPRFEPTTEEQFRYQAPSDVAADTHKAHHIASLGGLVAALSLAFSAPFWTAASSLHPMLFDALLLLATVDLLARYHYTGDTGVCMAAAFLLGLGVWESPATALFAPLGLLFVLLTCVRFNDISESLLLLVLATGITGAAASLSLSLALSDYGDLTLGGRLWAVVAGLVHAHLAELQASLPRSGWLMVLLQSGLPLLLAVVGARLFSPLQDEATRRKWAFGNILVTGFIVACLAGAPYTIWRLIEGEEHLAVAPSLAVALAAGALFVYWLQFATEHRYSEATLVDTPPFGARLLGFGLCGLIGLSTLLAVGANFNLADGRQSEFADRIARAVLAQASGAHGLLADGALDMNLAVRNHLSAQKLVVLSAPTDARQPPPTLTFVERWLRANQQAADQVVTLQRADLWLRAGLIPVPYGLVYKGAPNSITLSCEDLLATNRVVWSQMEQLLASAPVLRPSLSRIQTRIRDQLSYSANDLGVLAERMKNTRAADEAYEQALRFNANNICASLNRFSLRLRLAGQDASSGANVAKFAEMAAQPGFHELLGQATRQSGLLAAQEADALMPDILSEYAPTARPPEHVLRALEQWLSLTRVSELPSSSSPMLPTDAPADASATDARLSQALAMRLSGKAAAAERLLRLVVREKPANLSAWSLLADILLNRGEYAEIERTVLPAMRLAYAQNPSALADKATLADMTEGCLRLRTTPARLEEARACFSSALRTNPKLASAADQLLIADQRAGNAAKLEEDILLILNTMPEHVIANALAGSLRLSQRRHAEAEAHLRRSVAASPTPGALNDLAELLRQNGRLAEAEQRARQAVRLEPGFYQAWDTLGNILLDAGRPQDAVGPLRCALVFGPKTDVRPLLTLTRIRIREGRMQEADDLLKRLAPLPEQAASSVRQEYASLCRQIAGEVGKP